MKDQSVIKGNLSQLMHFFYGQTWPYEMRPNKTNFGLSFGYFFWRYDVKGEEEKEEEKKKRKPIKVWILVWICYGFV